MKLAFAKRQGFSPVAFRVPLHHALLVADHEPAVGQALPLTDCVDATKAFRPKIA